MPSFCDPARVGGWFVYRATMQLRNRASRSGGWAAAPVAEVSCFCFPCVRGGAAESKKVPCRKPGRDGIKISRRAFGEARSGQRPK